MLILIQGTGVALGFFTIGLLVSAFFPDRGGLVLALFMFLASSPGASTSTVDSHGCSAGAAGREFTSWNFPFKV